MKPVFLHNVHLMCVLLPEALVIAPPDDLIIKKLLTKP